MPRWLFELDRLPMYAGVRAWLTSLGATDFNLVFGAATAPAPTGETVVGGA